MNKLNLKNLSLNLVKLNLFISVLAVLIVTPMLLKGGGGSNDIIYWFPYIDAILFIIPAFIVIKGVKAQEIDRTVRLLFIIGIISIIFDLVRIRVLEMPISFKTALICVLATELLRSEVT